ncbi:MAG: leucine-rich repeat protein [Eubacterium sp.]
MKLKKLILCLWVLIMVTMILPIGVFAEMLPIAPEAMVKKEPEVSVQTEKKEETKNSVNLKEDQISESIQPETVQEPYIELPSFDIPAEVSESTKNEMPTLMQGQQIQKIEPQAETKTLIESDYEYKDIDGGVEITKYTGNAIQVKIPSLINSEKVVSIGMEAFINNNTIESVTLGSNTKIIGKSAFRGCNNLTTAKLNEGLEKLAIVHLSIQD